MVHSCRRVILLGWSLSVRKLQVPISQTWNLRRELLGWPEIFLLFFQRKGVWVGESNPVDSISGKWAFSNVADVKYRPDILQHRPPILSHFLVLKDLKHLTPELAMTTRQVDQNAADWSLAHVECQLIRLFVCFFMSIFRRFGTNESVYQAYALLTACLNEVGNLWVSVSKRRGSSQKHGHPIRVWHVWVQAKQSKTLLSPPDMKYVNWYLWHIAANHQSHQRRSQAKAELDLAACKTALGELYFVGAGVPRNLTKAETQQSVWKIHQR